MRNYYLSVITGTRSTWDAVIFAAVLRIVSWGYALAVTGLRWCYRSGLLRSYDLGRPVISVGNLSWGGTGKTPVVTWIVRNCLAQGRNPVILTRGYMPRGSEGGVMESDEGDLLREIFHGAVPVIAQKDRVQGALRVPADYAHHLFVLDDGFQHWRVQRDLNIVVIDAMNPFGNGAVIPRGILREPMLALRSADVIVMTRTDLGQDHVPEIQRRVNRWAPGIPVIRTVHAPSGCYDLRTGEVLDLSSLSGQEAWLVSGIGNPDSFEQTVRGLGVEVKEHRVFADHYVYQNSDIDDINRGLNARQESCLITTAKDATKLEPLLDRLNSEISLIVLEVEIKVTDGEEELSRAVDHIFSN